MDHAFNVLITNEWDLADCLQRDLLNINVIHLCRLEETIHDKRTLFIDSKVFRCERNRSAESLNRNLGKLDVLGIDVQDSGMENSTDLVVIEGT